MSFQEKKPEVEIWLWSKKPKMSDFWQRVGLPKPKFSSRSLEKNLTSVPHIEKRERCMSSGMFAICSRPTNQILSERCALGIRQACRKEYTAGRR